MLVKYNITNRYYYIKNILGDVIKIVDSTGSVVVIYTYSAYGKVLSITGSLSNTIGEINPIRYRSYYYDTDTNMYYLKTRYYNPEWCRFISSDNINYLEYSNPLGVNLFSYCNNNPVMYLDKDGHMPEWLKAVLDVGFDVLSIAVGIGVGVLTENVPLAIMAGSAFNNAVNAIYYNYIADENRTDLTSSSYNGKYMTRWDRLDYTKSQTKSSWYGFNKMRFYGEYSFHMYGHYLFPYISNFDSAEVDPQDWDKDHEPFVSFIINLFALIFGLSGI